MKVAIDKELEKISIKDRAKFEVDPLTEVKLLLENNEADDVRILRGLSNYSEFSRMENLRGTQLELENIEKEYKGKIFTIDQIKTLAIEYNLRFLSTRYFTGKYDVQVAAKIKEFSRETNTPTDDYTIMKSYCILAPENCFTLENETYVDKKTLRDPLLFYKVDNTHFRLIHKWGNDFSVLRYLDGFKWKNWWSYFAFMFAMVLPFVALGTSLITSVSWVSVHPIGYSIMTLLITAIVTHVGFTVWKQDEFEAISGFFSYGKWNSHKKVVRN